MLRSQPHKKRAAGFTLLEVLVAAAILIISVSAMAALAAVMLTRGRQARYINVAEVLANEKLEDLSRWTISAPQICVPSGHATEGSLTASLSDNVVCPNQANAATTIYYYDDVSIDFTAPGSCSGTNDGCFAETVLSNVGGTPMYQTVYHSQTGVMPGNADGTSSPTQTAAAPTNLVFHRSWLIEANTPVTGVRRITVHVTLLDMSVKPGVNVQMSMVRQ